MCFTEVRYKNFPENHIKLQRKPYYIESQYQIYVIGQKKMTRSTFLCDFWVSEAKKMTFFRPFFSLLYKMIFLSGLLQTKQIQIQIQILKSVNSHGPGIKFHEKLES